MIKLSLIEGFLIIQMTILATLKVINDWVNEKIEEII